MHIKSEDEALQRAKYLLLKTTPNYSGSFGIEEIEGVGYLVWQEVRGGGSIVIGSDGGFLFSNITGIPNLHEVLIESYKSGKRSDESTFGRASGADITEKQAKDYVQMKFNETDSSDRIEDRGFAFYVNSQPRDYLDTKDKTKMNFGNGPIVILKSTGEIFSFSSNPLHMFGKSDTKIGVNTAKTAEEFQGALDELKGMNDYTALHPERLSNRS